MQITLLSHIEYILCFLVLYLKITSLNSLKIMKKSLITEYSDMWQNSPKYIYNFHGHSHSHVGWLFIVDKCLKDCAVLPMVFFH